MLCCFEPSSIIYLLHPYVGSKIKMKTTNLPAPSSPSSSSPSAGFAAAGVATSAEGAAAVGSSKSSSKRRGNNVKHKIGTCKNRPALFLYCSPIGNFAQNSIESINMVNLKINYFFYKYANDKIN